MRLIRLSAALAAALSLPVLAAAAPPPRPAAGARDQPTAGHRRRPSTAPSPGSTASTGWWRRSTAPPSRPRPRVRSRRSSSTWTTVVEKDAVVARLKDTEHRARVAQAAADLKSAAAQLEQARDEHARGRGALREEATSPTRPWTRRPRTSPAPRRPWSAATARLEQAQEQLEYTEIRAPYSGIVTHRHVQVGEIASPGQPVMSGISLEELRVIVDVPQSVIPAVRGGGTARGSICPDGKAIETRAHHHLPLRRPGLQYLQGAGGPAARAPGPCSPGCSSRPAS